MSSVTDIWNLALVMLGSSARVTSTSDEGKASSVFNAIYEPLRDAELAAHPWSFAIKRAALAASATAPAYDWDVSYPLPADYLRVVEVGEWWAFYDTDYVPRFDVEADNATGRMAVVCNETAPLNVRYVYRVTNSGLFAPLFVTALAAKLAETGCESLTQNPQKRQLATAEYERTIAKAKRTNAIEKPPQQFADGPWVRAMKGF